MGAFSSAIKLVTDREVGGKVDDTRARELLSSERRRVEQLIHEGAEDSESDRSASNEPGDMFDSAERQTAESVDDAVTASLRDRLDAIERAEERLSKGTYGLSVRSGLRIPDERLEADPAAELTVGEATAE